MSNEPLVRELEAENAAFEALLDDIGEARMTDPGVAGYWSIKDLVAHLTGWRRRTVARLRAGPYREPEPPPWPSEMQTDDEINAFIYEQNRDRSLEDVLRDSRQVFQDLVSAIHALPDSELQELYRRNWDDGKPLTGATFFGHFHEEHEPGMRAWLRRQTETPSR